MSLTGPVAAAWPAAIGSEASQDLVDLAFLGSHEIRMLFVPSAWAAAPNVSCSWTRSDFPPDPRNSIPKKPGVYVFVVSTDVFNFPSASGLLYVGKATNLYERIGSYMGEKSKRLQNTRRPLVWRMLTQWNGHLKYYYTITSNVAAAEILEDQMRNVLMPPFNTQYDATMGPTMRAFQ